MNSQLIDLEEESIYIIREAIATADNPVILFSVGKDSCVLLHLIKKAFFPSEMTIPILHIDTKWKFNEMIEFRENLRKRYGLNIIVYTHPALLSPFTNNSVDYTSVMKTEALKRALDLYKFDIALCGARRDEEKSRAKERVFSLRSSLHTWDPKNQRPELWNLYNTRKQPGESFRVFPLSNWTELDVWKYIKEERLEVVPLYFAKKRKVVIHNHQLFLYDDDRFQLKDSDIVTEKTIRFRTLGCYPLTAAIESNADTIDKIIEELENSQYSERIGRVIDYDEASSMEMKKREGYF